MASCALSAVTVTARSSKLLPRWTRTSGSIAVLPNRVARNDDGVRRARQGHVKRCR